MYKDNHDSLPEVFTESIEILRQRGLTCKGLFCGRCEGRKAKLLEKAWDMGRNPLKAASFTDCYAVRSDASFVPCHVLTFTFHHLIKEAVLTLVYKNVWRILQMILDL